MQQTLPSEGLVRMDTVLQHFPVSESTWRNGVREGKYPKPVKLSHKMVAWKVEDIRKLLETFYSSDKEK